MEKYCKACGKENCRETQCDDFEIEGTTLVKYKGKGGAVVIPDGVTEIGYAAFLNCRDLTSVGIPSSVTRFAAHAFAGCSRLTRIDYKGTKMQWENISKDLFWNDNTGKYTVYCTDGTIVKSES